jgi:hypothetical protein
LVVRVDGDFTQESSIVVQHADVLVDDVETHTLAAVVAPDANVQ